jgi:Putative restriction endonuclease
MSVAPTRGSEANRFTAPLLENGDRLTRQEFHHRYQQCPEHVKAELIEGVVHVASPVRRPHAIHHPELSCALCLYKGATPGVEVLDNATTLLGLESESQPDLALRILPEWGGNSQTDADDYVVGAPELLAEIAHSSRAYDLRQKRGDYRRAGVREYIVWSIEEPELHWFDFTTALPLMPNRRGIFQSRAFPGLWIARQALLERDTLRLAAVVQQGTASRSHAAFVKRLHAARRKQSSG